MENSRLPRWQRLVYPSWLVTPLQEHLAWPRGSFATDTFRTCLLVFRLTLLSPVFWIGVVLWFLLEPIMTWQDVNTFSVIGQALQPLLDWARPHKGLHMAIFLTGANLIMVTALTPGILPVWLSIACFTWFPAYRELFRPGVLTLFRAIILSCLVLPMLVKTMSDFLGVLDILSLKAVMPAFSGSADFFESTGAVIILTFILLGSVALLLLPVAACRIFDFSKRSVTSFSWRDIAVSTLVLVTLFAVHYLAMTMLDPYTDPSMFFIYVAIQFVLAIGFVINLEKRRATGDMPVPAAFD